MVPLVPVAVVDYPRGMYCGGNQVVSQGDLAASTINMIVVDPSGVPLRARVQVQTVGGDEIIIDRYTDDHGRLKLRGLRPGEYWLGVSSLGFNLHYWHLSESRLNAKKVLRIALSLGT